MRRTDCILFFIVLLSLIIHKIQANDCATPCISNSECVISYCDPAEKICIETVNLMDKDKECCKTTQDCIQQNECELKQCNMATKKCETINVCSSNSNPRACTSNNQCNDASNICVQSKCIDGFCQNSPFPEQYFGCCLAAGDCPEFECSIAYCNVDKFACYYVKVPGCMIFSDFQPTGESGPIKPFYFPYYSVYTSIGHFDAGEIVGATVGFSILSIFILVFLFAIILKLSQPIYEKFNPKVEAKLEDDL